MLSFRHSAKLHKLMTPLEPLRGPFSLLHSLEELTMLQCFIPLIFLQDVIESTPHFPNSRCLALIGHAYHGCAIHDLIKYFKDSATTVGYKYYCINREETDCLRSISRSHDGYDSEFDRLRSGTSKMSKVLLRKDTVSSW